MLILDLDFFFQEATLQKATGRAMLFAELDALTRTSHSFVIKLHMAFQDR